MNVPQHMLGHTQKVVYRSPVMMPNGPVNLTKNQVCHVDTQDGGANSLANSKQELLTYVERIVGIKG